MIQNRLENEYFEAKNVENRLFRSFHPVLAKSIQNIQYSQYVSENEYI